MILAVGAQAEAAPPPKTGAPAPAFALPVVANGSGTVSLASLRGRGVYLNFFASWCGPCKEEVPHISELSKEYAKRNVVVIGVDELEAPERAKLFAAQYRLAYKIVSDDNGNVGGSYGLIGLPLHVFIAPDGKVSVHHEGQMSAVQIRTALQSISRSHR
jgi:thiol-disulfide isomerase/thioredoxin